MKLDVHWESPEGTIGNIRSLAFCRRHGVHYYDQMLKRTEFSPNGFRVLAEHVHPYTSVNCDFSTTQLPLPATWLWHFSRA